MQKAIFFKEWIKARRYFWGTAAVSLCFVVYVLLRLNRVVEFKGAAHLWEILLTKNTVFIELLEYIPLAIGILLAVAQFVPEMLQKRLKLTLHLPFPQQRMILSMVLAGILMLAVIFAVHYLILWGYLMYVLAPELWIRILLTALPWYLAGFAAYLFTAWICLEPVWKRRGIYALIAAAVLRIFFVSDMPEAYNCMLWILLFWTIGITGFSLLSVNRFKQGKE